jgi:Ca-activated chloride channel family protein
MSEFHFLRPLWLAALLALPLIVLQWRRLSQRKDAWAQVCDPHLLRYLRDASGGRGGRSPLPLVLLAATLLVLALAGPAWERQPQPLSRVESALIIALDLSEQVRAADLRPDRLTRARFKIADLLRARSDGQTALIAYAGDAFTVAPLTDDSATLMELLRALDPEVMPSAGQRADRAIELSLQLLHDGGFERGDLLLLTDFAATRDVAAAERARAGGLRVHVLGVGTTEGAPIPLSGGGFQLDPRGNIRLPQLQPEALQRLALAGQGNYAVLTQDNADLEMLGVLEAAGSTRASEDEISTLRYRDDGPWLLLLLLPVAALAFRRGWLLCLPLALLMQPGPALAFDLVSLWQRDDQRAWQALQEGDAEQARALADTPELAAAADYRRGAFAEAAEAFAAADHARGNYNRGNALARAGRFDEALAAYDEALALEPSMEDAIANRQAVLDWMQQQEDGEDAGQPDGESEPGEGEQQSEGEVSPQEGESSADSGEAAPEAGSEGEPQSETGEQGAGATDGEAAEPDGEFGDEMQRALEAQGENELEPGAAAAEIDPREQEDRQAVEQLLRRVPDDPGGLLRRKFALEHQRRLREGGGDR